MKTSMRCSIAIMMGLVVLGSTIPFASALSPAEVEAQYVAMENAGPDFNWQPCGVCATPSDIQSCPPCMIGGLRGRCVGVKVCQTTNIHVDGSNPLDTYVHTTSDDDERKYVAMENAGPDFKWYPCPACAGSQADGRSTCAPCLNDNERGRCGPAAGQCTVNGVPTTTVNSLPTYLPESPESAPQLSPWGNRHMCATAEEKQHGHRGLTHGQTCYLEQWGPDKANPHGGWVRIKNAPGRCVEMNEDTPPTGTSTSPPSPGMSYAFCMDNRRCKTRQQKQAGMPGPGPGAVCTWPFVKGQPGKCVNSPYDEAVGGYCLWNNPNWTPPPGCTGPSCTAARLGATAKEAAAGGPAHFSYDVGLKTKDIIIAALVIMNFVAVTVYTRRHKSLTINPRVSYASVDEALPLQK